MIKRLFYYILQSLRGKTLVRIMMNEFFMRFTISGTVLDLGGGENPSYLKYFNIVQDTEIFTIDNESLNKKYIHKDLEKDIIPFGDTTFETVLAINLLEHIFNYTHVVNEGHRVLKEQGAFLGFVPFMVNVHKDPHDYFRYTDEALEKIFLHAGFPEVQIIPIGFGPVSVLYNTMNSVLSARYIFWLLPLIYIIDYILLTIRPSWRLRFPLGYFFKAVK